MPKVSIIIPMYNVENYIGICLDSVMNQTMQDFEVIIIDDGSKDHSYERALEYQKRYPDKIQVYKQENAGQGAVRNNGVKLAKGDYILFVDSDDTVSERFVEAAYHAMTEQDADMGIFDADIVDENRKKKEDMIGCHSDKRFLNLSSFPQLLFEYPAPWNKIYRKSLFTDNELEYPTHMWYEDLAGATMFYTAAKKIVPIHESLYYYMQRSTSVMHSKVDDKNIEILKAMDIIIDYYKQRKLYDIYYPELEYVGIYHVLVAAAGRTVKADANSPFPPKFVAYMNDKFPNWKKNMYIKQLSIMNQIKLKMLQKGNYRALYLLYKFQRSVLAGKKNRNKYVYF